MKDFPNVQLVQELATFLNHRQIPDEDLCRFLMFNTFRDLQSGAVLVAHKNKSDKIGWTKAYGTEGSAVEVVHDVALNEELPVPTVIRTNKQMWIDLRDNHDARFPGYSKYTIYRKGLTGISTPIRRFGVPVGALTVYSDLELEFASDISDFCFLVTNLIAMRFYSNLLELPSVISDEVERGRYMNLKPRQKEILELMVQDFTNLDIAKKMGCDEITIREDALDIYQTLYVHSRLDAIRIGARYGVTSQIRAR